MLKLIARYRCNQGNGSSGPLPERWGDWTGSEII